MDTFEDVISALGGASGISEILGVTDSHARVMKTRGVIPPIYWPSVVKAAEDRGLSQITHAALAEIYAVKRRSDAA